MKEFYKKVKDYDLHKIIYDLSAMTRAIRKINSNNELNVYSNWEVCNILGVTSNLLARYRNEGLLPFSQVGDKYWYTQDDVNKFLENIKI